MWRQSNGLVSLYERCLDWLRAPVRRRPIGFGGSSTFGGTRSRSPLVDRLQVDRVQTVQVDLVGESPRSAVTFGDSTTPETLLKTGAAVSTTTGTNPLNSDPTNGDPTNLDPDNATFGDSSASLSTQHPFHSSIAPAAGGLSTAWSFNQTVLLRKQRRGSSVLVWSGVGTVAILGLWAITAPLAETIAVEGKLEPGSSTKRIDTPVPGVVEAVLVKEGQQVRKGDPLVRFDLREPRSRLAAAESVRERLLNENRIAAATLGDAAATAGLTPNQRRQLASQAEELASRRESAQQELRKSEARLAGYRATLSTYTNIANRYANLVAQGAASEVQLLEARQRVQETASAIAQEEREIARLESAVVNTGAITSVELRRKMEENLRQIAELDRDILQARQQIQYGQLAAPADGTVFDIEVSPGSVVAQGTGASASTSSKPLMKVVPQDALQARVYLPNTAVGFVRPGQEAQLSFAAFEASDFGTVPAVVQRIASDALTADEQSRVLGKNAEGLYYPAVLQLERQSIALRLKEAPLRAGMTLTADIKLRERRFINIFTGFFEDQRRNLERLR